MKKLFACLLAAVVLSAAAPVFSQQASGLQPLDRIAAVVDEDVILRSELDRAVNNVTRQYTGRENQLPPREVLERQVLERLVLMKLQLARAEQTGVRVTDQEVDSAIAGIAQQNRFTPQQLREQAVADGGTFEDFRNSIRDELVVQRLRQRFAQSRISVSEAEIEAAMSDQKSAGAQFRLAHILVALPEGATPEQISTARSKIEGVQGLLTVARWISRQRPCAIRTAPTRSKAATWAGARWTNSGGIFFADQEHEAWRRQRPLRGASGFQLLKLVEVRDEPNRRRRHGDAGACPPHPDPRQRDHERSRCQGPDRHHCRTPQGWRRFRRSARQESQDLNSQAKGGDLGWFVPEQFGTDFGGQIAALTDGQVSAPFRTDAGWHIAERVASRQTDSGEENRRAQISDTIGRRKLEDEWNRYLQEMRGEAYFLDMRNGLPAEQPATPAAEAKPAEQPNG
jgi:peptidyl-prolyl cis-trans isomerase SurA